MTKITADFIRQLLEHIDIPDWQQDTSSRAIQEITESFTGEPLTKVPIGTEADVAAAFERARYAQADWEAVSPKGRGEVLKRFANLVHRNRNMLLDVIQAETGKARTHALDEVMDVLLVARYYAKRGPKWLAAKSIPGPIPALTKAKVVRRPVGVVGVIAPWNYPLSLSITDALAAVMAGNAIVMKPDSQTPLTALAAVQLLEDAGLPRGLWQIVTGQGRVVGTAIAKACDYLMFTGSSKTGQMLGAEIGGRLIGYSAELGGKNPMIVDEGVNYAKVAEIACRACFSSSGQLCISIERIYAVGSAYDALTTVLANRFNSMKLGSGPSWMIEMGSLTGSSQLETVKTHVEDAVAKGATVLAGGRARPDLGPFFFEPTLLADVPEDAICYRNETFGPVVSIYPAASLHDAIAQANDTEYGLNSSVFCRTTEEAMRTAQALNTGMVNINEGFATAWSSLDGPSGGWGVSGIGFRHSEGGLLKYTKPKTIGIQSKKLHFGGPKRVPRRVWAKTLEHATNAMKLLP